MFHQPYEKLILNLSGRKALENKPLEHETRGTRPGCTKRNHLEHVASHAQSLQGADLGRNSDLLEANARLAYLTVVLRREREGVSLPPVLVRGQARVSTIHSDARRPTSEIYQLLHAFRVLYAVEIKT